MKTTVEQILEREKVLWNWGGFTTLTNVEEKPEDIWMIVKYNDHGDDFLVIGTRDGNRYEYGYYLWRNDYVNKKEYCNGNEEEFNRYLQRDGFIRTPVLYKKHDERSKVSNKIYFETQRKLKEDVGSIISRYVWRKYHSRSYAEEVFNEYLAFITEMVNGDTVVNMDRYHYKDDVKEWLKVNEMDTDENLEKLNNTKFSNIGSKDGDGICGKRIITDHDYLCGDEFKYIYLNGKLLDVEKQVQMEDDCDDWGVYSYSLCLKGFRPSLRGAA